MSINKFKKMIMVSSFAVIAISANAQDKEENGSIVSTGMRFHAPDVQVDENAREDGYDSGLARVVFDQMVIQPSQGLLSVAAAFCRFSYQHPATTLAMTAAYAMPVVAALMPDQVPAFSWFPSFTCAKVADTQQLTYTVNGTRVTNSFVRSDAGYNFAPWYGTHGYVSASDCAYDTWSKWLYKNSVTTVYSDPQCTSGTGSTGPYMVGQPYYTMSLNDVSTNATYATAVCVQATSAP